MRKVLAVLVLLAGIAVATSAKADVSCGERDQARLVVLSKAPSPAFGGIQEFTMSAARQGAEAMRFTAYDSGCHVVASHQFQDFYNFGGFKTVRLPGLGPTVWVESESDHCGSGSGFDTAILAMRRGRLMEIRTPKLERPNLGGMDFVTIGPNQPAILLWRADWQEGEGRYSEHRYKVWLFRWNGTEFVDSPPQVTDNKYLGYGDDPDHIPDPVADPAIKLPRELKSPHRKDLVGRINLVRYGDEEGCRG